MILSTTLTLLCPLAFKRGFAYDRIDLDLGLVVFPSAITGCRQPRCVYPNNRVFVLCYPNSLPKSADHLSAANGNKSLTGTPSF